MGESKTIDVAVFNGQVECPSCNGRFYAGGLSGIPSFCPYCGVGVVLYGLREHVATDQGNGGSNCSNCSYNFGGDSKVNYETCPKCNLSVREGGIHIQAGGSDFP